MIIKSNFMKTFLFGCLLLLNLQATTQNTFLAENDRVRDLKMAFADPPATSFPGVYWYFMDGNLSKEGMTKDLESMKAAGINNLVFLEVGIGVPRGPVDFMSPAWQDLFVHAVREAERLEISIRMGAGPGWCGSGGPWVPASEAMQHLVFSETTIAGGKTVEIDLPVPEQRSTVWHTMEDPFYRDVVVYAVPERFRPVIADINEKALFERDPYSSEPNVKPYITSRVDYPADPSAEILSPSDIINVSAFMTQEGRLIWNAPEGNWTIIRMGNRVTGASTRPSPEPVIGLEVNKLNAKAFENHLKNYTDILLEKTEPRKAGVGWTGFHMDSWESGAQNWTEGLPDEFRSRRGYDPEPYLLSYTGRAIFSVEITERFLWDLRKTCQELLLENHVEFALDYAHKNGLELTIEPYDMNPAGDLDLGSYADVIMAEFWSKGYGFETAYAVLEATSISHITGLAEVGAEVFTANGSEAYQNYPGSMKDQTDWALALGVNRFVYHTFAHKPLGEEFLPGMTMGPIGVHWNRGQTWWPMVGDYHRYVSRYSHMMQQGQAVSDILYLTPEGAPMVFTPPTDALEENGAIPDKKGYGFDGCSPKMLMERAEVQNGRISFPGASTYRLMVLPNFQTMTPELLEFIGQLIGEGATVIGSPIMKSPGLTNFPQCDRQVSELSRQIWGDLKIPEQIQERDYGKGKLFWGGALSDLSDTSLYPSYESTAGILRKMNVEEDFTSENNSIRYGHRRTNDVDIYFIANRTDAPQKVHCTFRATGIPEIWNGITGHSRPVSRYSVENGLTTIPMEFHPFESFVVTFSKSQNSFVEPTDESNFASYSKLLDIGGPWMVSFDPRFGGPESIEFTGLMDWTSHSLRGIQYYSGIATYKKSFTMKDLPSGDYIMNLGTVHDIARVRLNGQDLGVVWCSPWEINITRALRTGENVLEIEVANRWINRLLGDTQEPDRNVRKVKFDNGMLGGKEYDAGRFTFSIPGGVNPTRYKETLPSGLLGPVSILKAR